MKPARNSSLKMSACSYSLKKLSDRDLLTRLEKTRGTERAAQHRMVLYLAEVERRKLYLPRGYASLFEFCTEYLKYSRSSAGRRISAARCIARFPRMAALFRRGECDLTILSAIAGIVTKENSAEIAAWLKGRSLREVEAFVARRHPERKLRDQVRQIFVMSTKADTMNADPGDGAGCEAFFTATPSAGSKTAELDDNKSDKNQGVLNSAGVGNENSATAGKTVTKSESERNVNLMQTNNGAYGAPPAERVVVERKYKLQFAVKPKFMEKYNKNPALFEISHGDNIRDAV
jgi:hypothetical protein